MFIYDDASPENKRGLDGHMNTKIVVMEFF